MPDGQGSGAAPGEFQPALPAPGRPPAGCGAGRPSCARVRRRAKF